ncbi:unnamed protein product [Albugo candida]|uniref:Uncharacterized protein n=1 Tax=Albugo candida TaxID=65357 RepID=A0A024GES3_9STRA|nr:unnamed protein product [Albugo candida]|eukprot:CCI45364.1 unnamed protein product [Albugo candida]
MEASVDGTDFYSIQFRNNRGDRDDDTVVDYVSENGIVDGPFLHIQAASCQSSSVERSFGAKIFSSLDAIATFACQALLSCNIPRFTWKESGIIEKLPSKQQTILQKPIKSLYPTCKFPLPQFPSFFGFPSREKSLAVRVASRAKMSVPPEQLLGLAPLHNSVSPSHKAKMGQKISITSIDTHGESVEK